MSLLPPASLLDPTSLLGPIDLAISTLLVLTYQGITHLGFPAESGGAWVGTLVAIVFAVRAASLPLVVQQLRLSRAHAALKPQLDDIRAAYPHPTDAQSLRAMQAELRAVRREHGRTGVGCLPALLQIPVVLSLYRVLLAVSQHQPLGAMTADLVASASQATFAGAPLSDRIGDALVSGRLTDVAAIGALVAGAAALTFVTQRYVVLRGTDLSSMPPEVARVQRLFPWVSTAGVLAGAAAVPVGILIYWGATNTWTLAQQALINRVWPAPGSDAWTSLQARRARRGRAVGPGSHAGDGR